MNFIYIQKNIEQSINNSALLGMEKIDKIKNN